jgi:hypothetical protein
MSVMTLSRFILIKSVSVVQKIPLKRRSYENEIDHHIQVDVGIKAKQNQKKSLFFLSSASMR